MNWKRFVADKACLFLDAFECTGVSDSSGLYPVRPLIGGTKLSSFSWTVLLLVFSRRAPATFFIRCLIQFLVAHTRPLWNYLRWNAWHATTLIAVPERILIRANSNLYLLPTCFIYQQKKIHFTSIHSNQMLIICYRLIIGRTTMKRSDSRCSIGHPTEDRSPNCRSRRWCQPTTTDIV